MTPAATPGNPGLVAVYAADDVATVRIELLVDGITAAVDDYLHLTYGWDVTGRAGRHRLEARAWDVNGRGSTWMSRDVRGPEDP